MIHFAASVFKFRNMPLGEGVWLASVVSSTHSFRTWPWLIAWGTSLIGHAFLSNFEFCLLNVNFTDGIDVIDVAKKRSTLRLQWRQCRIWKNNPHKSKGKLYATLHTSHCLVAQKSARKRRHPRVNKSLVLYTFILRVLIGKKYYYLHHPQWCKTSFFAEKFKLTKKNFSR